MSPVLYALVLWILVSVPLALFFGAVCRLNQLPLDADAAHIAPRRTARLSARRHTPRRRSALLSPIWA